MPLWSDPGEVDDALDGAELPKDIVERCTALRPEGERAAHEVIAVAGIGVQLQLRECAVLFPREADELPDAQLRAELEVDGGGLLPALDAHVHQPQHVHRQQNEGVAHRAARVEARADGGADDGHRPESGGGRQALDLMALGDENGARAEKAQTGDDRGRHTHEVGRAEDIADVEVRHHHQRGSVRDNDVGAEARRLPVPLALIAERAGEHGREQQPHRDGKERERGELRKKGVHPIIHPP